MIMDLPLRGVEHIVHPESPVGLCPFGDLQFRLRRFWRRIGHRLRRLLHLCRRFGRLRGGLRRSFRPAGGEAQFHGQRQKKCEDRLNGKHTSTFVHNNCSPGAPFARILNCIASGLRSPDFLLPGT